MQCFNMLQKQKAPSCTALGCFDGVHIGHRAIISAMCNYAHKNNFTSSVFTFTDSPAAFFGKTPQRVLMSRSDKMKTLDELGVEKCYSLEFAQLVNTSPERFVKDILIETLNTKAVFCGFNYRFGKSAAGDTELLRKLCNQYGVDVFVTEPVCMDNIAVSSSRIRELIENGNISVANKLLAQPFSIELPIVEGKHNGRTVGIPTVNQTPPAEFVTPKFGVYASFAIIDGKKYEAVTNVGVRPTVGAGAKNYETHILGEFCGELYGQTVRTQLLDFVRSEKKFDSLEALSKQIQSDIKYIYDNDIFNNSL